MLTPGRPRIVTTVAAIGLSVGGGVLLLAAMGGPLEVASAPARPACDLPPARCTGTAAYCSALVLFSPAIGPGYEDVPSTDGYWHERTSSYLRRDLMIEIQYAAARVACIAAGWPGNGGPVALLDMSEHDGSIPGSSLGAAGHPPASHLGGRDIDIAYYQVETPDNRVRPVCPYHERGGPVHHCVGWPDRLDARRTALFIGILFERPGIRVVGVDGRIGPRLEAALRRLAEEGVLTPGTLARVRLRYETSDTGLGWYTFHHHHFHVSLADRPSAQ